MLKGEIGIIIFLLWSDSPNCAIISDVFNQVYYLIWHSSYYARRLFGLGWGETDSDSLSQDYLSLGNSQCLCYPSQGWQPGARGGGKEGLVLCVWGWMQACVGAHAWTPVACMSRTMNASDTHGNALASGAVNARTHMHQPATHSAR